MKFHDRTQAGFLLAEELTSYKGCDGVVLSVPRGGVIVGYPIAHLLHLPLDLIFCKKIGHPLHPEFAIGAVSIDGAIVMEERFAGDYKEYMEQQSKALQKNMMAKRSLFTGNHKPINLKDKIVILVDDGIATGLTITACLDSIHNQGAKQIILSVPVIARSTYYNLLSKTDELICLLMPDQFNAVGEFYDSFPQVSDETVMKVLEKSRAENINQSPENPIRMPKSLHAGYSV